MQDFTDVTPRPKGRLSAILSKIRTTLATIMIVLSVMGVVTFSLFILEESFQTVMFGTWPAQDAQRWDIVKRGTDHMQRITDTILFVNKWFGWIQPFAFVSYREYAISSGFYIEALRAKVLAHAPELMIGETVQMSFRPKSYTRHTDGSLWIRSGSLTVIGTESQYSAMMHVAGTVRLVESRVVIDIRPSGNS